MVRGPQGPRFTMQYLTLFFVSLGYVGLRAFQQQNVTHSKYWWVAPTSYAMAAADVFVMAFVARGGWAWQTVLANGTGASVGCLIAMWIHKRWVHR